MQGGASLADVTCVDPRIIQEKCYLRWVLVTEVYVSDILYMHIGFATQRRGLFARETLFFPRINLHQSLLQLAFNLAVPNSLCLYSFILVKYHLQLGLTADAVDLARRLTLHHVGWAKVKWTLLRYIWDVGDFLIRATLVSLLPQFIMSDQPASNTSWFILNSYH